MAATQDTQLDMFGGGIPFDDGAPTPRAPRPAAIEDKLFPVSDLGAYAYATPTEVKARRAARGGRRL